MLNPNVAALARLLRSIDWNSDYNRECERRAASSRETDTFSDQWVVLAEWLAKEGVLVISDAVLTDEEVREMVVVSTTSDILVSWDSCDDFRAALSRLAKGEGT